MKKILLTFLLAVAALTSQALTEFSVGQLKYYIETSGDAYCNGLSSSAGNPTSITIPGRVTYNGTTYYVTNIATNAFKNNTTLQQVRVGWGVQQIGSASFMGCTALKYVWLPSSTTVIYNQAFQNCTSMLQFQIAAPTPPTFYGDKTFYNMKQCTVITALQSSVSAYNASSQLVAADSNGSITYNGNAANDFNYNGLSWVMTSDNIRVTRPTVTLCGTTATFLPITSAIYDSTNKTYGAGSDLDCDWTEIAPYACYGNSTLQKIGRSDTGVYFRLKKVGEYAFYNCSSLTEVNISAQEIASYAFYNCSNLATVNLYLKNNESYGTQKLGERCFARTAVSYQYLPQSLTDYGDGAFAMCSNLENFGVSSNNTLFETFAGWLCSENYETIYQVGAANTRVGNGGFYGVTRTIKPWCFAGCYATSMLKIPYGVTTIGNYAFYEANITSLLIPSSVTSISSYALSYMSYLEHLYYNKPTPASGMSFTGLKSGCVLSVPYNNTSNYRNNSTWSSAFTGGLDGRAYDLKDPDETGNTTLYFTVTSVGSYNDPAVSTLTTNGQAKVVRGDMPSLLSGTIDIPMRYYDDNFLNFAITEIEDQAFSTLTELKIVRGGEYIKKIGQKAFYYCWALTTVNIPNLVTIGEDAFYDCTKLSSFTMGNRLESIGGSGFGNCSALAGEITMPATLSNIGSAAFLNCTSLQGLFLSRTQPTTFGRVFYGNNADNFACFVEISQFYDFYSKIKTTTYSSNPEVASKKLLPWVKPTTQWTPISVPVDDDVLLPSSGEFYIAPGFNLVNRFLVKQQLNNNQGIKGGTGMLLKGTVGTIYRFRRKTDVSNYTYYTPTTNYLKGVTGASQTLTYTASGPWNYIFNGSDRFSRVTSSQSISTGKAYVQLAASDVNSINVPTVYIEDNATRYNLWINGEQVTSVNCGNLAVIDGVSGTVTYTPGTNTLKLSDATITSSSTDNIRNEISGLKITVTGTNNVRITAGYHMSLRARESVSISGTGTLYCWSDSYYGCSVTAGKTLTLSGGVQATFHGKYYGIYGSSNTCRLIMSGASTKLTAYGQNYASINCLQPTLNDGLTITQPAGAYFNSDGNVVNSNGNTIINQNVVISKPEGIMGDVNNDGVVNITDVTLLISAVMSESYSSINFTNSDLSGDGILNVTDVTMLISKVMSSR